MSLVTEPYVRLGEDAVDRDSCDAAYNGKPLHQRFPSLRSGRVSSLILLFFSPPAAHDAVFRLAASPGASHIQDLVSYVAFDLRADVRFSMIELRYVVDALVRLDHALNYATAHGLLDTPLPRDWRPDSVVMPAGDTPVVYEVLSRAACMANSHPIDYLFPYAWPPMSVNMFGVDRDAKTGFAFRLCAMQTQEPVQQLRHYLVDCNDNDLFVLTQLSQNSATSTIGALMDNTPSWVDRTFNVGYLQMVRLLSALRSLEYGLIMLSELQRRGLTAPR